MRSAALSIHLGGNPSQKGGVSRSWTAAEPLLFDLVLLGDALELRQDPGVERVRRGVRDLPYGKFSLTMALASETVEPDVPLNVSPPPIDLVHRAIAAGTFGQIQWDDRADERARSNPDLQGLTPEGIRRLLHEFVHGGGRLDERREARAEWLQANADRPSYLPRRLVSGHNLRSRSVHVRKCKGRRR